MREKLLVLSMINTFQPISEEDLTSALPARLHGQLFNAVLKQLLTERLVRTLGDKRLLVTFLGRSVLGSGRVAKARDIARILHLFSRSKEGKSLA